MKYHPDRVQPHTGQIFVFGSNLAGIHGKGAAQQALEYGARWGCGDGIAGNTYAIATKDARMRVLPRESIRKRVSMFLDFARAHPEKEFFVTRIGCGLAGYRDADIAPMFALAPDNCDFAEEWRRYLEDIRV